MSDKNEQQPMLGTPDDGPATAPGDGPAADAPADQASVEQAAGDQTPADPSPADQSPADQSPWANAPSHDQMNELEAEVGELKDQLLRALAETENVRKRGLRQIEDAHKYAVTNFARDLINVADNMARARAAIPVEDQGDNELVRNLLVGIEAVEKGLMEAFEMHHISRIDPLGEVFDPNIHEAMFEMDVPDQVPGTVAQVVQSGFLLHDRLLRPARVAVARGGTAEPAPHIDTKV